MGSPTMLLKSLGRAASRQRVIASLDELPARSRLSLALLDLTRTVRPRQTLVNLGPLAVELDAESFDIDWYVFRSIFLRQDYRADYRGASVVDIGAHKGYFGAYALLHGARHVLSVEPESRNFASLATAAGSLQSSAQTWEVLCGAVSDRDGEGLLFVGAESWSHTLVPGAVEPVETTPVRLLDAASVLERGLAAAEGRVVVKIDAEGAETEIVLAAQAEAWSKVDQLFVELHDEAGADWRTADEHLRVAGLEPSQAKDDRVVFVKRRP